jgi:hypothetical protein
MLKKGDRRGLSKTGIFILILLIILIFVAYFVVKNVVLKGSGDRSIGKFTLDLKISSVQIIQNNSLDVVVRRNKGAGQFTGINFIIDDGKAKERISVNASMSELESRSFIVHLDSMNVSEVKSVSIDPIFVLESQKEYGKNIKDEYIIGSEESNSMVCKPSCPEDAECGDDGCGKQCNGGCIQEGYTCLELKCVATLETKCLRTNIAVTHVRNVTTNFSVTLSREGGEDEIEGIKLVFTNKTQNSNFVMDTPGNIALYEASTRYIAILYSQLENPSKVRTIVYFTDENDMQQFCEPSGWTDF